MMGGALVCFRKGTTDLLRGRRLYVKIQIIFGIPNARMSSYPCFQHLQGLPRLDKFVSGIPNAITSQSPVAENDAAGAHPRLPIPEIPIERAHIIAV
jgi:hypothetical protein